MNTLLKKSIVVGLLVTASQASNAVECLYVDQQFSSAARSGFSSATTAILSSLQGMDAAVKIASAKEADAITQAVFVLSNQKAASTTQISTAIKNNTQVQANAMQAIGQAERYQEVLRNYGVTAQGYDVCNVHAKREEIQDATTATQQAIDGMVRTEITARAGRYANKKDALATRLALHKKYYCTEGQAKAGLCDSAGPRAANSLSAATMFKPADYLSAEYNDKSAFINNMIGLPDDPVPANQATTLAGQSYSDLKRRKDAIKSTAMTSLKALQAEWSTLPPAEGGDKTPAATKAGVISEKDQLNKSAPNTIAPIDDLEDKKEGSEVVAGAQEHASLMVQVKADVARYLGGGPEYEEWSKMLVGQEEKGILTEVLRVKALRLYLQTQEFKQLQRMEAMFAANVAVQTENTGMSGRVEAQRQVAVRQTIRDNIVK